MKKIIVFILLMLSFLNTTTYAEDNNQSEILEMQKDSVNISDFINEANGYTKEVFDDLDMGELLNSAIKGNVDNESLFKKILGLLGKEVISAVRVFGSIIIIIIIHSVLKSISEGLENKGIAQITYYIQYILIVSLIMVNFSEIISIAKTSIENLVGFVNSLIPILMTLMLTSREFYICRIIRTNFIIYYNIYRKSYKCTNFAITTYINSFSNCF